MTDLSPKPVCRWSLITHLGPPPFKMVCRWIWIRHGYELVRRLENRTQFANVCCDGAVRHCDGRQLCNSANHPPTEEQKRDTQRAGESCSLNMACREGAKRWSYRYDDGYYYYYSVWTFHLQAIYCFGSDTG